MGGDQAEKVQQRVHPGRLHVHEVFLLAAEQVPAVHQPERVHHVRHVRQKLLHFSQNGVRPVGEERFARGGRGQGMSFTIMI